jgi:hypothetical protein
MRRVVLCVLLVSCVLGNSYSWAVPETSLATAMSWTGSIAGARFGSELACSQPVGGVSRVAVGAPLDDSDRGRVYLFNPAAGATPTQVVAPSVGEVVGRFGASIEFIDDINSDGVDDLVVGAPGSAAAVVGKVFAFTSSVSSGALQYQLCGVTSGGPGFGEKLQGIRQAGGASGANLVVANPELSELSGFMVFFGSGGTCSFSSEASFSQTEASGTRFGSALAQVAAGSGSAASIAVAASDNGALGATSLVRDVTIPGAVFGGGVPTPIGGLVRSGSTVAGYYGSGLYVVGSPRNDSERGVVSIYPRADETSPAVCSIALAGALPGDRFGATVAHLHTAFSGLIGVGSVAVAASRAEVETGGSVVVFGAETTGCSALHYYNNCQSDSLQEQGAAIYGGEGCVTVSGGVTVKMLLVGSPGWNGHRGRVDIAVEGDELPSPQSCFNTPTATPSASMTPEPTATPSATPTTTPTPTYTVSSTPTPVATVMPTAAQTVSTPPTPVATMPSATSTPDVTASAISSPRDDGQIVIDSTPKPVIVFPGASGLPTPEVSQVGDTLEIRLPEVTPQLSTKDTKRAVRSLLKRNKRMSRKRAEALLADPDNLVVTYIVHYSVLQQARFSRFSFIDSAHAAPLDSRKATKVNKIRTRNASVALGRIQRGAMYRVAYQVEIALRKPRTVIGTTKLTTPTVFKTS